MTATPTGTGDLVAALEALLFVADRPLSTGELAELAEVPSATVTEALGRLAATLDGRGIRVQQLDDAWQLTTAPEVADRVRRYAERTEGRLSPAAVEALAVVAYRQPATRGDVERVRGVDSESVMRSLLHRRLITEAGRRDSPGRPILYRTTFTFLERFGMESLGELPALDVDPAPEPVSAIAASDHDQVDGTAEPEVAADRHAGERLQTVLARAGHGSRRAADRWIADGRVTVNGTPATPGTRVDPGRDAVALDGRPVDLAVPAAVHLAIHKPRGVLSSTRSGYGHRTVVELVTPPPPGRLWPAGRLDLDSEGLMLLTNDGAWAQRVLHPRFGLVRQYAVQLDREPDLADLEQLRRGIEIDGAPAQVLDIARSRRPAGVGPSTEAGPWFAVHLGEGRNREVRRLFAAIGYRVHRLVRTAYGPISLAGLEPAAWRPLTDAEVTALEGGPPPSPEPAARPRRATRRLRIAVDGTSGSGKSTVGRALAERIGARFVDTGLLYRAVTLAALEAGIDPADGPAVARLTDQTRIRVRPADGGQPGERVTIGRREVTPLLREPRIERAVPTISQHAEVRAAMLTVQRDAARGQDTVMVGRDIGTVVLPDADLKVFLTASVETRARRRAAQMGRPDRVETYQREITERDRTDSTRALAPLRRAPGALVLDSGELDVDECVAAIVAALPPGRL